MQIKSIAEETEMTVVVLSLKLSWAEYSSPPPSLHLKEGRRGAIQV